MPVVQEDVLAIIGRKCQQLATHHDSLVQINEKSLASLATDLASAASDVKAACIWARPPICFDDMREEIDYISLASLLDFGSGWDSLLLAKPNGRPAREAAEFAVLGLAMQGSLPDASALAEYGRWQISGSFNIDPTEESTVDSLPGVTMTSPGPLAPFLGLIQKVMNETGRELIAVNHSSLGSFVLASVEARRMAGLPPSAAALVEDLADKLPAGFADVEKESEICGQVVFHRKAQQCVGRLFLRFGKSDPRFDFQDINELSMDSGPVLAASLAQKGVLMLSSELEKRVNESKDLFPGSKEVIALRAAVVDVGRRLVELAGADVGFAPRHVSSYLLREVEGKEEQLKCFRNKQTTAY